MSAFQLSHSRGVRRHWCLPTFRTPGISTHALTWSATDVKLWRETNHTISTHALTWSATPRRDVPNTGYCNFNSRTHVECDDNIAIKLHNATFQLTHSRGVRPKCPGRRGANDISTHALTWSATMMDSDGTTRRTHFNSRTHVECDRRQSQNTSGSLDFNSRTHVECDLSITGRFFYVKNFNSRTHVECDMSWYGGMGYDY